MSEIVDKRLSAICSKGPVCDNQPFVNGIANHEIRMLLKVSSKTAQQSH